MSREEDELDGKSTVGSIPRPGEDPRFRPDGDTVTLVDNGAYTDIEDLDAFSPVEVDQDPYLPWVADEDGVPGYRPYVENSLNFEQSVGLESKREEAGDDVLGDEFKHRLEQRELAAYDNEGRPVSDLAQLHRAESIRNEEQSKLAPYVNVNPESVGGALMGGNASIAINAPPVQVAQWSGEDVETRPVSVMFSPVQPIFEFVPMGSGLVISPYGIVQFGTRSYAARAEVDIGLGCQFTVFASQITLQVALDTFPGLILPSPPPQILLGGQLSFNPIVRTSQLTRTIFLPLNNFAGVITTVVPAFAKSVTLWRPTFTDSFLIEFLFSDGNVAYTFTLTSSSYMFEPVPLATYIAAVRVTQTAGNNFASLIFNLSI